MGTSEVGGPRLRRILLEGVVIVSSILLAFGIDAWWNDLQDERAFARTLDGLEAAFSENLTGVESHLELLRDLTDRLDAFFDADPAELLRLPEDSAHVVLVAVQRQGTASLNNEYLTELVDAADLSGHPELDAAVAVWRRQAFLLRERRAVLVDLEQRLLAEASRYPELDLHIRSREPDLEHGDPVGLALLRENPDVVALATLKAHNWSVYATYFRGMRDASTSLVAMLRAARGAPR